MKLFKKSKQIAKFIYFVIKLTTKELIRFVKRNPFLTAAILLFCAAIIWEAYHQIAMAGIIWVMHVMHWSWHQERKRGQHGQN